MLGLCRRPRTPVVPYVSMTYVTQEGAGGPPQPGFFGGLLGRTRDPNAPGFDRPELGLGGVGVNSARLSSRKGLPERLRGRDADRPAQEMAGLREESFSREPEASAWATRSPPARG